MTQKQSTNPNKYAPYLPFISEFTHNASDYRVFLDGEDITDQTVEASADEGWATLHHLEDILGETVVIDKDTNQIIGIQRGVPKWALDDNGEIQTKTIRGRVVIVNINQLRVLDGQEGTMIL